MQIQTWFSAVTGYFSDPEKATLQQITEQAKNQSLNQLIGSLNSLCGTKGYAEINIHNDNYQIHLFFDSQQKRQTVSIKIIEKFNMFNIPTEALSKRFDIWQFEDKGSAFCLKLSTNQSTALIGFNPNMCDSFNDAQKILKNTKEAMIQKVRSETYSLQQLPVEVFHKILLCLNLQEVGRCGRLSKVFYQLSNSDSLWHLIAAGKNIPIINNSTLTIKNQVKTHYNFLNNLEKTFNYFNFSGLAGQSKENIEKAGGICLVNIGSNEKVFNGTAVGYDEESKTHVLVFVGLPDMTEKKFDQLMTDTHKKLCELKIIPKSFQLSYPRWSEEDTEHVSKNFKKWQEEKKKFQD